MTIKIAINGLGRIGRCVVRAIFENSQYSNIELVALNGPAPAETHKHLLKYDSIHGRFSKSVEASENSLIIDGKKVKLFAERDPKKLPWRELGIDVVFECTGAFTQFKDASLHIEAGAKKVIISAPAKGGDDAGATILMGVNEEKFGTCNVTSNASCTTNASSPLIGILDEAIGIEKAILSTTHGYTASQALVDGPSKKDLREGRAAAQNIVPSSTGAAIAVAKAYPKLDGLFDGISLRVPVPAGSIVDVTFIAKRNTDAKEVNEILKKAAADARWSGVFAVTEEPLVSSDILGNTHASIADLEMTRVVGGNLVKVLAWYDNEWGYTCRMVDLADFMMAKH